MAYSIPYYSNRFGEEVGKTLAVALMFFGTTKQKYHVPPDHRIYVHHRTKLFKEKQVKNLNLISKRSLPFPEAHSAFCWSHLLYNCLKLIIQLDVDVLFRPALNWSTWGTAWKTYDANKQPAKWSLAMLKLPCYEYDIITHDEKCRCCCLLFWLAKKKSIQNPGTVPTVKVFTMVATCLGYRFWIFNMGFFFPPIFQ